MTPENFFLKLRKYFSTPQIQVLISALRQEPLVWEYAVLNFDTLVENPLFVKPEKWTPDRLGLFAMGYLREENAYFEKAQQKASEILTKIGKPIRQVANLEEAMIFALIQMTAIKKSGKTQYVFSNNDMFALTIDNWKSIAACIPQNELKNTNIPVCLTVHNLLCQPLSEEELTKVVIVALKRLSNQEMIVAMQLIAQSGRKRLTQLVAEELIGELDNMPLDGMDSIQTARQQALIYQAAGKKREADELLSETEKMIEAVRNELKEQQNSYNFDMESGFFDSGLDGLSSDLEYFKNYLLEGEIASARKMGQRITAKLVNRASDNQQIVHLPEYVLDSDPSSIIRQFQDLGLEQDALQVSLLFLKLRPTDVKLLKIISSILENLGDFSNAIKYADIAVTLDPQSMELQKRIAELYLNNWECETAYILWENLVKDSEGEDTNILMGYADAALHTNRFEQAIAITEKIILADKNNARGNFLSGLAYLNTKRYSEAVERLNNAVLLDADNPDAWLALADGYTLAGEEGFALDALRRAVMLNPDCVEINYALAEVLLSAGEPTEALPYLKKCVNLSPRHAETAIKLGKTLGSLGNYKEAEQIYCNAFQKWPADKKVANGYIEILLATGNKEAAIKPLETIISGDEVDVETLLLYVDCLFGNEEAVYKKSKQVSTIILEKGISTLERILILRPEHQISKMLLAEAAIANSEFAFAKKLLEKQIESEGEIEPDLLTRIKTSLGLACLQSGEMETAIAVLQEASQAAQEDIFVHQKLAEAFEQMKLMNEAMQTAEYTLRLAPAKAANLRWYAMLAERAGRLPEAISALESAAELDPENAEFALNTARLMIQNGEGDSARMWLEQAINNPKMTAANYKNAAYSYLRLQDVQAGYACLQKAVEYQAQANPEWLLEYAMLTRTLFGDAKALEIMQSSSSTVPAAKYLLTYQADLYHALHQDDMALELLQKASVLNKKTELKNEKMGEENGSQLNTALFESLSSKKGIDSRIASLYFAQGNLISGMEILENLLTNNPNDLAIRTRVIEAAYNLLDYTKVQKYILPDSLPLANPSVDFQPVVVDYLALVAEIALHFGNELEAGTILNELIVLDPCLARIKVLQARLLFRKGDIKVAQIAFQDAVETSKSEWAVIPKDEEWLVGLATIIRSAWLADAAFELGYYAQAIEEAQKGRDFQPGSLLNQLRIIHAFTQAEYANKLRAELYVENHMSDFEIMKDGMEKCLLAYTAANNIQHNEEIEKWGTLSNAIFDANPSHVQAMLQYEPDTKTAHLHAAVLRWINNHSNAMQICTQFERQPDMLLQLALCNLPTDVEQAVKSIARAISYYPNNPLNYVVASLIAEETQDYTSALSEIESAIHIWQDEPEWFSIAARIADALGDAEKALEYFRKSASIEANGCKFVLAYGYALMDAGQSDSAVVLFEGLKEELKQNQDLRIALASAQIKTGNVEKAVEIVKGLKEEDCETVDALILYSQLAYREGKDDEAVQHALQALNVDSHNSAAIYYVVQLLRSLDRPVEALSNLEQHIQDFTEIAEFKLLHAELVYEVDGALAALPHIEELNALPNKSLRVVKLIARVRNECGQQDEFTAVALEGLKINPTDAELNLLLGKAQSKTGQLDQAVQYYAEVIRQTPDNVEAYLELAELFKKRREDIQAVNVLKKAITAFPHDYRPCFEAGSILKEMKDYSGAEIMLRRAAELAPSDVKIRRQLGAIIALNLVHQV